VTVVRAPLSRRLKRPLAGVCGALLLAVVLAVVPASVRAVGAADPSADLAAGEVVGLAATPHLWVADDSGVLHWAGDTRALAGRDVRWDERLDVPLDQLQRLPRGDPWLSAGLLQDGGAIYLVKWELEAPTPQLLRVRSIGDLELFGIGTENYGREVLDRASWEARYGVPVGDLPVGELAPAVAPPVPTAVPPTAVPPTPTPRGPFELVDAFAGADGTPLSVHNRAWRIDGGGWELSGNRARMGAPGGSGAATVDAGSPDHEVQAAITLPPSTERYPSDWFAGLYARFADPNSNIRARYLYQDNSPEVEVWEINAGRGTLLDFVNLGPDALLPGSTHTMRLVVDGRQVVVYHDGAPVARGQTGLTGGARAGIGVSDNLPVGRPQWDDVRVRALR
jgi:hypothetical protein